MSKQNKKSMLASLNAAITGFFHVIKTQRSMRVHFVIAVLVLVAGVYLNFSRTEIMFLCLTIGLVLVAEMFNTIIEFLLDRLIDSHDARVKVIKDISAGTVLVASINAVIIAYFLFFRASILQEFNNALLRLADSDWHITFLVLVFLSVAVILSKIILHKGTPLRGGMPSGHAALSFSMCTIIALVSANALVSILAFVLAFLVSQGRVVKGVHTVWEVFAGASLGILTTIFLYQLFAQGRSI